MPDSPSRVILDPSFLSTDEALGWIGNPELAQFLVVSEALWRRMEDPQALAEELERFGTPVPDPGVIEAAREVIDAAAIAKFSYERASAAGELERGTEEVCRELFVNEEPLADALADEWAFVTSQSLAVLVGRAGDALGAFTRAGATVYGVAKGAYVEGLERIQDKIPPGLLNAMKGVGRHTGGLMAVVLAGGSLAAELVAVLAVPPVGIALAGTEFFLAGNAVLAGDP